MSKLDPAQIVDEALAVVRSDGEAALSMRLLATKLGVPITLLAVPPQGTEDS